MAKRKIIAHIIGVAGLMAGLFAGYTIIQAEMYMNLQDYKSTAVFYFWAAFFTISSPFFMCRLFILDRRSLLIKLCLALCLLAGLASYAIAGFSAEFIYAFLIFSAYLCLPIYLFEVMHFLYRAITRKI